MKLEVTHKGIRDQDGKPVEIGTVLNIKGDTVPVGMVNKVRVIADKGGKTLTADTAVTMPGTSK